MELFLLFSLALTLVAFLSIVLAEPPTPLTLGVESEFQLSRVGPTKTVLPEQAPELSGQALLDDEHEPAAAQTTAESLQAMY